MRNQFLYPSLPLRPYIQYYHLCKLSAEEQIQQNIRDFPRTALDIAFCFTGGVDISVNQQIFHINKASLIGQFDQPYIVQMQQGVELLHVRFKPAGFYPLTKVSLQVAINREIELDELLGPQVDNWYEYLGQLNTMEERIQRLEQLLIPLYQSATYHHRFEYGIQQINATRGQITVQQLSEQLHSNYKTLDRWFKKYVGFSPKRYIQLTRFKYLVEALEQNQTPDYSQLAYEFGFCDQAHFIKEFKQFAQVSPGDFWQNYQQSDAAYSLNQ
ncbi:MAG: helix-turn-helix domain-containing protein [Saprospiraceae bacterium]